MMDERRWLDDITQRGIKPVNDKSKPASDMPAGSERNSLSAPAARMLQIDQHGEGVAAGQAPVGRQDRPAGFSLKP